MIVTEAVARSLSISKGGVAKYVSLATASGLQSWGSIAALGEAELERRLFGADSRAATCGRTRLRLDSPGAAPHGRDADAAVGGVPGGQCRPAHLGSDPVLRALPVEHWHAWLGDPTIADALLDRLLCREHRIQLKGESVRRAPRDIAKKHGGDPAGRAALD
jgi:hypothetical protein